MERPEHLKEEHDRVTNTIDQAHLEGIPDLVSWMDFYYWLDNFCIGKGRFGINALKNLKHPDMFWPLLSFNQNSVSVRIWIEKDLAPLNWRLLAALVKVSGFMLPRSDFADFTVGLLEEWISSFSRA